MLVSRPPHGFGRPVRALTFAFIALACAPACRCGAGTSEADASSSVTSDPKVEGVPFVRDAEPKVGREVEAGVDPACTGAELSLAARVADPRCAINAARAKHLRALLEGDAGDAAGDALPLRQDAKLTSDGRIELRLVNAGATALTLPLSYHAKLPAFTALAEDEQFTVYELESPRLDVPEATFEGAQDAGVGAGGARPDRPHFASIVLAPGGAAVATLTISPVVVRVMRRGKRDACGDASAEASGDGGACHVTRLPKGRYTLHVGELLTDVEAGAPARVGWSVR